MGGMLLLFSLVVQPQSAQAFPDRLSQANSPQADLSQSEPSTAVPASGLCVSQNALQQDEQIVLGNIPDFPYVVVVPGQREEQLSIVRQCIPDAFQTHSRLGSYIQAGAFPDYRPAERLSRHLRRLKLNARVMYLP